MKNNTSTLSFFNLNWVGHHHGHTSGIAEMIMSHTYPTSTFLLLASLFFFLDRFRSARCNKHHMGASLPPGPSSLTSRSSWLTNQLSDGSYL